MDDETDWLYEGPFIIPHLGIYYRVHGYPVCEADCLLKNIDFKYIWLITLMLLRSPSLHFILYLT